MYSVCKLRKWNIVDLWKVSEILYKCGKDMAQKRGLHHWDNIRLKWWIIIVLCTVRNDIFLVYKGQTAVATFQIRKQNQLLTFQKLATSPEFAGNGTGTFCLNKIEELAKMEKYEEIICEVYDKSEHAIQFYQNRGYVIEGAVKTRKYNEWKLRKVL